MLIISIVIRKMEFVVGIKYFLALYLIFVIPNISLTSDLFVIAKHCHFYNIVIVVSAISCLFNILVIPVSSQRVNQRVLRSIVILNSSLQGCIISISRVFCYLTFVVPFVSLAANHSVCSAQRAWIINCLNLFQTSQITIFICYCRDNFTCWLKQFFFLQLTIYVISEIRVTIFVSVYKVCSLSELSVFIEHQFAFINE